jgi:hypothetical protein
MKKKAIDLGESVDLSEAVADVQVDEQAGVIRGVVMMTGEKVSKNKTKYLRTSVQEGATRYDGAQMYLDHPRKDDLEQRRGARSIRDLAGVYRNLRIQEGAQPKLLGDLHLFEGSYKQTLLSIAKNPPKGTGLSLRDRGNVREEKGVTLVEGFVGEDYSIDFVVHASLNKGLFESAQTTEGGQDMLEWDKITLEDLTKNRKDLVESIQTAATAPLQQQLTELGKTSGEASKLVALAESKMPLEFKEAIKPSLMKAEVTLEEAKKIIVLQEGVAEKFTAKPAKGKTPDPSVKGQQNRSDDKTEELEEGERDKKYSNDKFVAAFGS